MTSLKGKTLFITGASRGIGLAIALRAARDGANVAIAAKTAEPHPKLEGHHLHRGRGDRAAGGKALPVLCDIRDEAQVMAAVEQTVAEFGGIDICVNNASAISLTNRTQTDMKRYDLMIGINTRGTFLVSKYCIPHLKKAANPHILMLSPPLDMKAEMVRALHVAYTMAKFGMSMCVLGLSGELKAAGIAVNALWPRTTIATAAVGNLLGGDAMMRASRTPEIMGDAAHAILTRPSREFTGQFCIDDKVLYASGVRDFEHYRVDPLGAVDVGLLRARRRRAAARRHRAGAAIGGRGADVALEARVVPGGARELAEMGCARGRRDLCSPHWQARAVYFRPDRAIRVATGFVAHNICSKTFVSGHRSADRVRGDHRPRRNSPAAPCAPLRRSIAPRGPSMPRRSDYFAAARRFTTGSAASMQHGPNEPYLLKSDIEALKAKTPPLLPEIAGPAVVEPSDPALKAALDHAFEEPATPPFRRTKAVVVVHDGKVIAERYARRHRRRYAAARLLHDQVGGQRADRHPDAAGPRHALDAGADSGMARRRRSAPRDRGRASHAHDHGPRSR